MNKLLLVWFLVFTGCGVRSTPAPVKTAAPETAKQDPSTVPLSQIDLSTIGAVTPKGRVQDRDYNQLPVVENLIAHGPEAIPFLIGNLEDETRINDHVFDYWDEVHVDDVAFIILTDFFTDPTGQKTTIPDVGYDVFLGRTNRDLTSEELLRNYVAKHGRHHITTRWRAIWTQYKDRIYWDGNDRCFKLRA